jgi:ATP-binding cassette subfamily F protein 3
MIILSLQHIQKSFGANAVLKDVSLTLQAGQRLGLVGVNGCGKTTLMRIIAGLETYDAGTLNLSRGLKLGYLAQQGMVTEGLTVLEELEAVFAPLREMEARMRELEARMAKTSLPEELHRLGSEYAALTDDFERQDGYAWKSAIQGVLAGLGFTKAQHDQLSIKLSGGERTRLCLARLLLQKPDLLLLDEPTNHLDLQALNWLENYLSQYRGTVLVISHDRYFLDHVCGCMAELLLGAVEQYDGNYTRYIEQRTERFDSRQKAYDLQQKEIVRQEAIIARYRSFNREKSIRAAESREKRLNKMERLQRPEEENQVRFSFTVRRRTGDDVLMVKDLKKSFGERTLFEHLNMHMRAGDRIALIGPNGAGKSTLFRCLAGDLNPDEGIIRLGANVDIGYYDQHQSSLHPEKTVLDEVWDDFRRLEQYEVRGALGLFLFTGDDVFMPVSTLSGGEKGRVALTKLMLRKDNLLLMDEPTNHLDMDSREVLEQALSDYPGTILAISHDRYFINRFANKVAVLGQDGLTEYAGNYDDYLQKTERGDAPEADVPQKTRTELDKEKKRTRQEKERIKEAQDLAQAKEKEIAGLEQAMFDLEALMVLPETFKDPEKAAQAAREYQKAQDRIAALYDEWEAADKALKELVETPDANE